MLMYDKVGEQKCIRLIVKNVDIITILLVGPVAGNVVIVVRNLSLKKKMKIRIRS